MKRLRDYHVEDLEDRGACFIRKKTIEEGCFGTISAGTMHYGEDSSVDIIVKHFPLGGSVIVGPAYNTRECKKGFLKLIMTFKEMEEDEAYAKSLFYRSLIDKLIKGMILVFAFSACFDIARLDLGNLFPAVYFVSAKNVLMAAAFALGIYSKRI